MTKANQNKNIKELTITRIFDAPRELVWKAWTEPDSFKKWWGPIGFTAPACQIDFRVGGNYLSCMMSPEGKDYWTTGTYQEIIPLERIVYTDSFSDDKGNIVPATYYAMSADFPLEMKVTVTFEDYNGKTEMTLRHEGLPPDIISECRTGWSQSFEKLADSLK